MKSIGNKIKIFLINTSLLIKISLIIIAIVNLIGSLATEDTNKAITYIIITVVSLIFFVILHIFVSINEK
jgi:hypothetical protein